jgi:endonuclease/exonuclease/phosphatase family metal-dependent hydrolase
MVAAALVAFMPHVVRAAGDDEAEVAGMDLRVMSFNIRYANPNDGDNAWPHRKALLLKIVTDFAPDLLGTQEVLHEQAQFLKEKMPGYAFHGVGRDDGKTRGEYTAIFYRKDRFEELDSGHVWLSEQPDMPGSVSWDSSMTRMFSWITLRDKKTDREIVFADTHWDHRGVEARRQSAILMRDMSRLLEPDQQLIVVGDFNTTEDGEPYRIMLHGRAEKEDANEGHGEDHGDDNGDGEQPAEARRLYDSYREVHPERSEDESTFSAFRGDTRGKRIDWILHDASFKPVEADIDRTHRDGRYPSDHYPVTAVLRY